MPHEQTDLAAAARAILDANLYMTLATADADGRPWPAPVYYALRGYRELIWLSSPDTAHSRNLSVRPEVGIVVFDSRTPIGTGSEVAVYMEGVGGELPDEEVEAAVAAFSARSLRHGGRAFAPADVRAPAGVRLYRATVSAYWMLDPDAVRGQGDHRIAVAL
jgi:hypothetical protein